MTRGGKRIGAGRKAKEPTITVRVPARMLSAVNALKRIAANEQDEGDLIELYIAINRERSGFWGGFVPVGTSSNEVSRLRMRLSSQRSAAVEANDWEAIDAIDKRLADYEQRLRELDLEG